jgi:hypothetical protein
MNFVNQLNSLNHLLLRDVSLVDSFAAAKQKRYRGMLGNKSLA